MASSHPTAGGHHSLAFRVMRLCRPSFHSSASPLRLHLSDIFAGEDLLSADDLLRHYEGGSSSEFTFRHRFVLDKPTDAFDVSGLLVLPQSFGAIYLGETFCSYISINNSSSSEAKDVIIKAEIQTEKQRILLLDTSKAPVESIRSGGRYDFIVEHDVKELGAHTLVCTALYNDGDSERKYLPQFFKFVVANPLSVRTKVRSVKDITFLEACIENHTKSNLYMDQVEFEPAQNWSAILLKANEHETTNVSKKREIIRPPTLIRAGGGIYNYLYQLKQPHESGKTKIDSNILGKLQITWRTNLGEPGRLQTQQIIGTPTTRKDIDLQIVEVPSSIILERPFSVKLLVTNQNNVTTGPIEIFLSNANSTGENAVMIIGIQKQVLVPVEALSSINISLTMIATRLGVQRISGISVYDTLSKKLYEPLPDFEIFVDTE